ncbi:MAG: class II glutamine amidotransferase [Candidatus Brocadiia bacterium]
MMKNVPTSKDISGCAITGMICESGERVGGELILESIEMMHERANGLGGGLAAYGIYPDRRDQYALHIMCDDRAGQAEAEEMIDARCEVHKEEPMPIRPVDAVKDRPILHRYFVTVRDNVRQRNYGQSDDDLMVSLVMDVNTSSDGAFIFSSGQNMGVFKGVGYPEDIGRFYRVDEYEGHTWTAHGRFPTNTTGWWGGAHPFGLLDWSVVHNGEISSYGINRRYLDNFGYHCAFHTDTEVITYMFDLLIRKHQLPFKEACMAMAPPFWEQIDRLSPERRELARTMRNVYGGALLNGPFSVLVGHKSGMIGLNDRIKLRPLVAARKDDRLFVASEEAAIRVVCPKPDRLWQPRGGEPVIGRLQTAENEPLNAAM